MPHFVLSQSLPLDLIIPFCRYLQLVPVVLPAFFWFLIHRFRSHFRKRGRTPLYYRVVVWCSLPRTLRYKNVVQGYRTMHFYVDSCLNSIKVPEGQRRGKVIDHPVFDAHSTRFVPLLFVLMHQLLCLELKSLITKHLTWTVCRILFIESYNSSCMLTCILMYRPTIVKSPILIAMYSCPSITSLTTNLNGRPFLMYSAEPPATQPALLIDFITASFVLLLEVGDAPPIEFHVTRERLARPSSWGLKPSSLNLGNLSNYRSQISEFAESLLVHLHLLLKCCLWLS